jgi:hypothetical protein
MSTLFGDRLHCFLSELAQEPKLSPSKIREKLYSDLAEKAHHAAFRKELLKKATLYRSRSQFGKLRASLLTGTSLLGLTFLREVEREKLLLSDGMPPVKYGRFLTDLGEELVGALDESFQKMYQRICTYQAYHNLARTVEHTTRSVAALLRGPRRTLIVRILALTHLCFLSNYLHFEIDDEIRDWLEGFGHPEKIGSIASLILVTANEARHLDTLDFVGRLDGILLTSEVKQVMEYGHALFLLHETGQLISIFEYRLTIAHERDPRVFLLLPPSAEFEYALRLGFLRSELNSSVPTDLKDREGVSSISMATVADDFLSQSKDKLGDVRNPGTPFCRIGLTFPSRSALYSVILNHSFYEDAVFRERLWQELLLPLKGTTEKELEITKNLNLETFLKMWKLFEFLSLVQIKALEKHRSDRVALYNSLVWVSQEQDLLDLALAAGVTREQAQDFFALVTADASRLVFYDMQYHPFLRIGGCRMPASASELPPGIVSVPAVVHISNKLRNVQRGNRFRFKANARIFVQVVAALLRSQFSEEHVVTERPLTKQTEVDVVLLEGKTLYIFECKYSVPAASPHELRDLWQDVEKAAEQLQSAIETLSDTNKLGDYLAGWFPGTKRNFLKDLKIQPCILCSHFVFSGLVYRGIPVRDFTSFSLLVDAGSFGMEIPENDETIVHRYRATSADRFTISDFDNYLGPDPRYFCTYRPFMTSFTEINRLVDSNVTLANETYVYEADPQDWLTHIDSLGFARMPVERRSSKRS